MGMPHAIRSFKLLDIFSIFILCVVCSTRLPPAHSLVLMCVHTMACDRVSAALLMEEILKALKRQAAMQEGVKSEAPGGAEEHLDSGCADEDECFYDCDPASAASWPLEDTAEEQPEAQELAGQTLDNGKQTLEDDKQAEEEGARQRRLNLKSVEDCIPQKMSRKPIWAHGIDVLGKAHVLHTLHTGAHPHPGARGSAQLLTSSQCRSWPWTPSPLTARVVHPFPCCRCLVQGMDWARAAMRTCHSVNRWSRDALSSSAAGSLDRTPTPSLRQAGPSGACIASQGSTGPRPRAHWGRVRGRAFVVFRQMGGSHPHCPSPTSAGNERACLPVLEWVGGERAAQCSRCFRFRHASANAAACTGCSVQRCSRQPHRARLSDREGSTLV